MILLGKYKLRRRIAESDIAELMLASQQGLAGLEQLVVVKRISAQPRSSDAFVRPFVEEVRRATQLKHHNVVEIFELHNDSDELCVVSDYVSGEDLDYILSQVRSQNATIPVRIACQIVSQAAEGLAYAHGATDVSGNSLEMLHRELCLTNVLISYNGDVKLSDFGQARADSQDVYSRPGTLKNKLAYRSPERLRHKEIDARSDIYSLGVIFYELLVGRRLFKGDTASDLLKTAMELEVPPPSQVNSDVPSALDAVVMSAIARDPDERTPTTEQFLSQLDRVLKSSKLSARQAEVADWMKSSFASRLAQRQHLEQTVAFDDESSQVATGVAPAFAAGATSHPSGVASVASLVGAAPQGMQTQQSGRGALWAVIGAMAVVLVLILLGVVYMMGRQGGTTQPRTATAPTPTPAPAVKQTAAQAPITDVSQSPASFLVHVTPHGAAVKVEGKEAGEVGPDGLLVPVMPGKQVTVVVAKKGYKTDTKKVQSPKQGTAHLYINLVREGTAVAAATTSGAAATKKPTPAPVAKVAVVKRTRPRRRPVRRRAGKKEVKTVDLRISYAPSSATVVLDGKVRPGGSPLQLDNLKPGTHTLTVRAAGYRSVSQRVELRADQPDVALNVRLEKAIVMVPVQVTSSPLGARVKINGKPQGTTPLLGLQMEAGRGYLLQVEMNGYKDWSQRVVPRAGTRPRIMASMVKVAAAKPAAKPTPPAAAAAKPKPAAAAPKPAAATAFGKIYVISPNVYGQVYVNGKAYGYPPVVVPKVAVGSAKVEIRVGGRVRRSKTVSVKEGTRAKVRFR